MTQQVPVRITAEDLAALDRAVAAGRFSSRSDALRAGLKAVLREEREREIEEAYRPGVILTRDRAIPLLANLTLAGVTSRIRDLPTEVAINERHGLARECVI